MMVRALEVVTPDQDAADEKCLSHDRLL